MKALVIEDESLAARHLLRVLHDTGDIQVITVLDSISAVEEWFKVNEQPELIFMDIHLADGSAFVIFDHVTISCPVIFTTAYDEYAIKAFKVNSIDYLLKPITREAVEKALDKLKNLSGINLAQNELLQFLSKHKKEKSYKTHFLIPVKGSKLVPLLTKDIACISIEDGLVKAKTYDGKGFILEYTLDEMGSMLNPADFYRANRQYIISKNAVREISFWFNSRLSVDLKIPVSGKILISKLRAAEFREWYAGI
jgi:DNA-binding LytR/AlgR family response regulator